MHRVLVATLEALCCTRGGFSDGRAWAVECTGSVVVARGFRSSEACGISVLRQGMEPMSPPLEGRFLTPGPQGSSCSLDFEYQILSVFKCGHIIKLLARNNEVKRKLIGNELLIMLKHAENKLGFLFFFLSSQV